MFFGGLAISKDEAVIKANCPHIVVGTPGRILALVKSKKLDLKNLKHFVLDECDKMLEQLGKNTKYYEIFSFCTESSKNREIICVKNLKKRFLS